MLIQGDPDKNFWEYNKELKFVTPFKKLYDDYGDKESSKIMWAIYLTEDPRSRFYRIPREQRTVEVTSNYYPTFDPSKYQDAVRSYGYLVLSKEENLYRITDIKGKDFAISCIYKIINLINGKIYIGQSKNLAKRFRYYNRLNTNEYLKNAFLKYGLENFIVDIVEKCDLELLTTREQYYLDLYKSYERPIGYNICKIANSMIGYTHTEITRTKLSISHTGVKLSDSHRQSISRGSLGRSVSPSVKLKISKSHIGKSKSITHINNIADSLRGRTVSEDVKLKISLTHKLKGRTAEHSLKLIEASNLVTRKMVQQLDLDNNVINVFNSLSDAARNVSGDVSGISLCCNNKMSKYRNYKWKFLN